MGLEVLMRGRVSRNLPQSDVDGGREGEPLRISRYNEQYVGSIFAGDQWLADEGSLFSAMNPTVGTGVAHALVTAFAATSGLFVFKNGDTANDPSAKRIYLKKMVLMLTAAPTAGVSLEFLVALDSAVRTPTAGNVAISPVNCNMDSKRGSVAEIQAFNAAALTVPAAGQSVRQVARIRIPTGINVIGDTYTVLFGDQAPAIMAPPLTAIRAAQPAAFVVQAPAVIIGPQQFAVIHRWSLTEATAAPSYEYYLEWAER